MSKNFEVNFIQKNFFMKLNKKMYNRAKDLLIDATIFVSRFYIVYLLKKWKLKNGPTRKKFILVELLNSSKPEDMRKIR